jgi:hypothetical protein
LVNRDWWTAAEWEINRSPRLAAWVNPIAQCPVCGKPVYFYTNSTGSRVFFDELGKPWPKHPCTDNRSYAPYELTSRSPLLRSPAETRAYKETAQKARIELPTKPDSAVLTTLSASNTRVVAIPMGLEKKYAEQYSIASSSTGSRPRKGDLLFRSGNEISFFHRPTAAVVTLIVKREVT